MKFDVVVGNPPYQENDNGKREDGSANASASPLYHHFFHLAQKVSNEKIELIFPARWLNGAGKGLGNFSKEMFKERHVRSLTLFKNSSYVFPNTEIKGGVLYLTYEKEYDGEAEVTVFDKNGEKNQFNSYLDSAGAGVFIPFGELQSIYKKVDIKSNLSSSNVQMITSVLKPFGLRTDFFRNQKKYGLPDIYEMRRNDSDIEVIGLDKMKRVTRYVPADYPVPAGNELVEKWKVFGPYAYGSGEFGESAPNLLIGAPYQISTETFLAFGPFENKADSEAFKKYFETKFFRSMIGILKTTQHSTTTYGFVPMQDFTANSDIDWTKSIPEIDHQLYKKYDLDQNEINFIEEKVKGME